MLQNFYKILGVSSNATAQQIKTAYRQLALKHHPDKGGKQQMMGELNEAFKTLSDPEKRKQYDEAWETYTSINADDSQIDTDLLSLGAGNLLSFSHSFRRQHEVLSAKFTLTPLEINQSPSEPYLYNPSSQQLFNLSPLFESPIQLENSVKLFLYCISGGYHDSPRLLQIKQYFMDEVQRSSLLNPHALENQFYEGLKEIIFMLPKPSSEQKELLDAFKKITDFAKQTTEDNLSKITPLFYHQAYRKLFIHALNLDFTEEFNTDNPRKFFDGFVETREFLNQHLDGLQNETNNNSYRLIRYLNLLARFEKELHDGIKQTSNPCKYRDIAFHALDWMPYFLEHSTKPIIANLFLQIGLIFRHAARIEPLTSYAMADEQLALKLFLTAISIADKSTPNIEIYIYTFVIKAISTYQFKAELQTEILAALKKSLSNIVDIFPFGEFPKSNIMLLKKETEGLSLMRKLLNTMVNAYEFNKTHQEAIPIEHSGSTILYQAYEACLKNWYTEEYQPELEYRFRLDLMEELLLDNAWSSFDIEEILDSSDIFVRRDDEGWLEPSAILPFPEDAQFTTYREINGFEINQQSGEIKIYLTPWNNEHPQYEKTFSFFDLQDMLERRTVGGIFSLDPVDAEKPFHPYNKMRFSPNELYKSTLLNCMLLTDYILKFLTTSQEVQGRYPFDQRAVEAMISHVPEYLKNIISKFQSSERPGALHRFWIEAEEIDVHELQSDTTEHLTKISLNKIKMVVKKHRMERDINGDLKDVEKDDEGWSIYVFESDAEVNEILTGQHLINERAIFLIYRKEQIYFWENHQLIKSFKTENYRETLIRIFKQEKFENKKIKISTKNMPLIYRLTIEMTEQAGLPHHFSPEFIFAHEFTTHYDEFAQFIPEFGRLRELCKISVLVKFLDGVYQNMIDSIEAIDFILNPSSLEQPKSKTYTQFVENESSIRQLVIGIFSCKNTEFNPEILEKKYREHLRKILRDIQPLEYTTTSHEVTKAYDDLIERNWRANGYRFSKYEVECAMRGARQEIANRFTNEKQASVRIQLVKLFGSNIIVDAFIRGNVEPALEYCILDNLKTQFPDSTESDIKSAIKKNQIAMANIAKNQFHKIIAEKLSALKKLKSSFESIHFGEHKEIIDLEQTCLWVPASIRHEVTFQEDSRLTRHSFFVYGGVNVQPRINISQSNGAISGNPVNNNAFNRKNVTNGFQDHHIASDKNRFTKNHELWELSGVSANSRVNKIYLPRYEQNHPTRSIHNGKHTNLYSENIANRMDAIVEQGRRQNWTQSQYRSETRRMLSAIRQDLRAGNIALNINHRPWAK